MNVRKTKIVCTLGPTTESLDVVEKLLQSGMNVARFNFSHGTHEYHKKNIETVRNASKNTGIPVAIMLDTKGPEIRTGNTNKDELFTVNSGDIVSITVDDCICEKDHFCVSWKKLPEEVFPGVKILVADGLVEFVVEKTDGTTITAKAMNSGSFGSHKNVNIVGAHPSLPTLTDQDKSDLRFGAEMGVDFIAASFINSANDVLEIIKFLGDAAKSIRIIAKIESEEGLRNIKDILSVAAGIMVARGDLGVQVERELIPLAQKRIIQLCNCEGKPVITATEMLNSMIENPRPTRAELTDVANAVFDGTDAVMLSGETANGRYPVEAVKTMAKIVTTVEQSEEYIKKMQTFHNESNFEMTVSNCVARGAYLTAAQINAKAILSPTLTGNTSRLLSSFRPPQPIIAVTADPAIQRRMLLYWGVIPLLAGIAKDSEELIQNTLKSAIKKGYLKCEDKAVMVAGLPLQDPNPVNTIRVLFVGTILGKGERSGGLGIEEPNIATGRVVKATSAELALQSLRNRGGEILVVSSLDTDYIPLLRVVNGLVIETVTNIDEELLAQVNPRLVWISSVRDCMTKLEEGATITLDGEQKIVFEGSM